MSTRELSSHDEGDSRQSKQTIQESVQSVEAGHIVEFPSQDTLSEGTAGGVEEGTVTFSLCRDLVDIWQIVSEDDIKVSPRTMYQPQCLSSVGNEIHLERAW